MTNKTTNERSLSTARLRYANLIFSGSWYGLMILLIVFGICISGSIAPHTAHEKILLYWSLPAAEFVHKTGIPTSWGWLHLVKYGDFMTFPIISLLLSLTAICSATLIPAAVLQKDWSLAITLFLTICSMLLAASGLL